MKTLSMLLAALLLAALPAPALADDGPEVTLHVEDAPLIDVIRMIAEMADVNVIVSPKVKGSVTVSFKDTPWRDALESVVKSTGNALVEQEHGIYTVLVEAEARKQLEYRKAAAEKRYAELAAEVDAMKKRLAKVRWQADEAAVGRDRVAAAQKAREAALAPLAAAKKARGDLTSALGKRKAEDSNEQIMQIHAIGDLEKKGLDIQKIALEVLGKDVSEIRYSNGHLSVRATRAAQERLAAYLGKLRAWKLVDGNVVPGRLITTFGKTDDKARVVVRTKKADPLKTKVYTTWKKTGKMPTLLTTNRNGEFYVSNDDGRSWVKRDESPWRVFKGGDNDFKSAHVTTFSAPQEAALKARAEKLKKAAALLASAGDNAGASRVRSQAAAALKQLAELRKQRSESERSYRYTRATGKTDAKLMDAVTGLRKEVGALRNDVRELTALVRKLVEQRR